jgi:UrcA family protein
MISMEFSMHYKAASKAFVATLSLMMGMATVAIPWSASHAATGDIAMVRVLVEDLNLNNAAGLRELDRRLSRAARRACSGSRLNPRDLQWKACVRGAVERVRPQRDALLTRAQTAPSRTVPNAAGTDEGDYNQSF